MAKPLTLCTEMPASDITKFSGMQIHLEDVINNYDANLMDFQVFLLSNSLHSFQQLLQAFVTVGLDEPALSRHV